MILARSVFQAKWGKSQEAVDRFKEMAEGMRQIAGSNTRARIYTDLNGPFHTVIQEVESLGEWETREGRDGRQSRVPAPGQR